VTPLKENLLLNLADYTDMMHEAFEGKDLTQDERLIYLGHLAMCARMFKAVCLDEPDLLIRFVGIENSSYKFGTPNNQRGAIAREAWRIVEQLLRTYIASVNGT